MNSRFLQARLVLFRLPAVTAVSLFLLASSAFPAETESTRLAERIDQFVENSLADADVPPAPLAEDAEFLRRVHLDLGGRIPAVATVRRFLADASETKRAQIVDEILESPNYITNFTNVWRNALIPEASANAQFRGLVPGFESWLWKKLYDNTHYDEFVREILTAQVTGPLQITSSAEETEPQPLAFYTAKEAKPESLASSVSRIFLGVRLDCAQCHDHPFDKWEQPQFWKFAAFFSGLQPANQPGMQQLRDDASKRSIAIPETDVVVEASFLDDEQPNFDTNSAREVLADWMTSNRNPWFARMAVNRVWGHMFGHGIVDPVDDFSEENPPSHPELLDELAADFASHDFDLKYLIREIAASRTYQRTSRQTHSGQSDARLFARMSVKGLSPEQLFDSLAEATGFYQPFQADNPFVLNQDSPRAEFLRLFEDESESPTERQTTILQALAMMNGSFITDATSLEDSRTLTGVADFPGMTPREKLDSLFLAATGRTMRRNELSRFTSYVANHASGEKKAFADVFWALLNSSEFLLNH